MKAIIEDLIPTPIAFADIFEKGDYWIKIRGCEGCQETKRCCGNCRLLIGKGCYLHIDGKGQNKPFYCVVKPFPSDQWPYCQQEFKCTKGSNIGKTRRVKDNKDIFRVS